MKDDITLADEVTTGETKQTRSHERIALLLDAYSSACGGAYSEDDETLLVDLLADLRHWAAGQDVNFDAAADRAQMHWSCETDDQ